VAETEAPKQSVELTVPLEEVESERKRVIAEIQKRVKLPGFRPGKAPSSLILTKFGSEIRHDLIEALVPKAFRSYAESQNLRVVGSPGITDVHFHEGEPLKFKIEFEVFPSFELGEYRGLTVSYNEPTVTDEDIAKRLEQLREQHADYVNVDPRPIADGDHAVVSLRSIAGVTGPPVESDEMMLHIGDQETLSAFNENLRGVEPGQELEIDVPYPEDYGNERLRGRTVRFHVKVQGIRRKELPELNDEFAPDVGDFRTLDELRDEVRKQLLRDREQQATLEAKAKLVDQLVEAHDFPVPEAFVDRQIENELESYVRELAAQGVDPSKVRVDWNELKKAQRDRAVRQVKASLLIDKIADREAIETLTDEVDREVHKLAKQHREPAAAIRMKLEKDGSLGRIASRIRNDKVLNFLFEQSRKVAPESA
jgi:trigger factor